MDESRVIRPQERYAESHYGGQYAACMHGVEDRRGPSFSSSMPAYGLERDVATTSKVTLPPVSQLLGSLRAARPEDYDVPVLPRLQIPERPGEFIPPMVQDRKQPEGEGSIDARGGHGRSKAEGKRREMEGTGRTDGGGEEKKTKVARKIYVACDFCRGKRTMR